jgi:hypothetical protein
MSTHACTRLPAAGKSSIPERSAYQYGVIQNLVDFSAETAGVAGDVYQVVRIPANTLVLAVLCETVLQNTGLTDNDVGDGSDPDVFIDGTSFATTGYSIVGEAGGSSAGRKWYSVEDTIDIKVNTAASGISAGQVRLTVFVAHRITPPTGQ